MKPNYFARSNIISVHNEITKINDFSAHFAHWIKVSIETWPKLRYKRD